MKVVFPKYKVEVDCPTIFLAGPIKGAPYWQQKAINLIDRLTKDILIASPSKRVSFECGLNQLTSDFKYGSQLDWERFYLEKAAKNGCILFWLPDQFEDTPINGATGFPVPYARDTRGELGEWRGRMMYEKFNLVIGGEDNFSGLDVITRNFLTVKPGFKLYNSLEETCQKAVDFCKR